MNCINGPQCNPKACPYGCVQIEVSFAWWFEYYLLGLAFFSVLMDADPDEEKLARTVLRALRIRIPGDRRWRRIRVLGRGA